MSTGKSNRLRGGFTVSEPADDIHVSQSMNAKVVLGVLVIVILAGIVGAVGLLFIFFKMMGSKSYIFS